MRTHRTTAGMLAVLALLALAVPGRGYNLARLAKKPPPVPSLSSTVWEGREVPLKGRALRFEPGGALSYSLRGNDDGFRTKGTWTQQGDRVTFELNKHYFEFEGNLIGGELRGRAWNKANKSWTVTLYRRE